MDSSPQQAAPRPTVIGIGASAGGLAALKSFLTNIPRDSGLTFVVVVHLSPDHESHLADLLQSCVPFPVTQVLDTVPLEPNHVYVIPPNANLNSIDTHLRLSKLERRGTGRAPIDHFFRTLAGTHDGHAVAVILTGTGSDGTLGIRDIKANGGLVIVQDPAEAEFDGMPQSAIATGLADFILPVAEIPGAILRFDKTRPDVTVPHDGEDIATEERVLLQKAFTQLRVRTERDFSHYKRSTVLRRIMRRMQLNSIENLPQYVEKLRESPDEVRALADDLLITVTRFFRDPEVFEKLKKDEIPRLVDGKHGKDTVRVWSVGSATGEEAYSLAMLLVEEISLRDDPPQIQIFASDLHTRSLDRAREGFYAGDIASDVSPERLRRFFQEENGGYRVSKEIRELVIFAPHNLLADPPFSRLDLISCRNLLIYLEREVQRAVIELFHYALNPQGVLVLGSAESVDSNDLFQVEDKKLCFFRKRNVPVREPRLPVFPMTRTRMAREAGPRGDPPEPIVYGALHQQMVEKYAPPSILVSPDNRVVHFSEHSGRYLVHPGGEPTMSALKLVREELRIELQSCLQAARARKAACDSEPIPVQFNGHARPVVMHVRPTLDADREGYALVIFEEREPKAGAAEAPVTGPSAERIRELEAELATMRQRLQATIREHETSQEEMKASSEEMQSTNEELRSTMEELETSKEELQSINEELQTVNQQNRHKVEELAQLSSDLQNLLSATEIATLFLDRELRILRFTPKLGELFNVRKTDRGRPISDLTHRLGYGDLRSDAKRVLDTLIPMEREVQDDSGRWYLTRILPYRSTDDRIEGVVITFIDIDTRKRMEDALRRSEERLNRMVSVEGVGVMIFDHESGIVMDCNNAWLTMSGRSREEVAARSLSWRTMTPPEYIEITEEQIKTLAATGRIGPYEKELLLKDGSRRWMTFAGATLGDGTAIEYCIDSSARKAAEILQRANADLKNFSYAVSHDMQEPLRMVTSYTQLLSREYRDRLDAQATKYIDYAVEGARRMESLLNDLREYWSVDEQNVEALVPTDCNEVLETSLRYLETAIAESGAVVTHDVLPTLPAEPYPLSLLFQNLVGNAVKYCRPEDAPKVHVGARLESGAWTFFVQDNGIGIPDKYRDTIFAPFRRLNPDQYPGTGLGLALCRRIVERYEGRIWADSTPGQGSTFYFTLPAGRNGSDSVNMQA